MSDTFVPFDFELSPSSGGNEFPTEFIVEEDTVSSRSRARPLTVLPLQTITGVNRLADDWRFPRESGRVFSSFSSSFSSPGPYAGELSSSLSVRMPGGSRVVDGLDRLLALAQHRSSFFCGFPVQSPSDASLPRGALLIQPDSRPKS
ncbi:hypothetical protein D9758_014960 [Tetrapyrgos nigripes]|uniref:Uncharacterized protein n=1 Tax=Tetrapyrgos nigripes TaxID=182062 RepID=A0A8H5FNF1_9AGAR|nr:hypothetical protein D9758_014960 [Tetrapyrgos nigripes]